MNTLHEHLRSATRQQHMDLHTVVNLDNMLDNVTTYRDTLSCYLLAVLPAESALREFDKSALPTISESSWEQRLQKSHWLIDDITDLGGAQTPASETDRDQAITALADFVGTAYVLEGMTLGNRHIAKQVTQSLGGELLKLQQASNADSPEDDAFGKRFFRGHADCSADNWTAFKQWLAAISSEVEVDAVCAAANRAFSNFATRFNGQRPATTSAQTP
ncbi:MAG: hypothetical protein Aurels2KO_50300 [Aureliella sp.]